MPYPAQVTCRLCSERELILVDASGKEFRSTKADEGETKAKNATIGQSACLERGLALAVHVYTAASLGLLICDEAKRCIVRGHFCRRPYGVLLVLLCRWPCGRQSLLPSREVSLR